MPFLEKEIEDRVVRWAMKNGFLTPKVKFAEAGWPDRMFISPYGHTFFIEFKRPGARPDALQAYRIQQLQDRGVPATWVASFEEAVRVLRVALESNRLPEKSDPPAIVTSISGAVLGSGAGQNLDLFGGTENTVPKIFNPEVSSNSTFKTDVQSVAGRSKEMDRLSGLNSWDPARDPEGDGPNYGITDTLD